MKKILATLLVVASALLALSACDLEDTKASDGSTSTTSLDDGDSSIGDTSADDPADSAPENNFTASQEAAMESAQSYLDMGGFSRKGLIQQLSSGAGEGFPHKDAIFAIRHLRPDWKAQAVKSARGYVEMGGFSRSSLIEQLSSDAGEGFTRAEAEYAANKVYR